MRLLIYAFAFLFASFGFLLAEEDPMETQRCVWQCLANANGAEDPAYQQCIDARCNGTPAEKSTAKPKAKKKKTIGWQQEIDNESQVSLSAASKDRRFHLYFSCLRTASGALYYHLILEVPRKWTMGDIDATIASIDGKSHKLDLGGVDDGWALSDGATDNYMSISPALAATLAGSSEIVITPQNKKRNRPAVFKLGGDAALFPDLEARCARIKG